MPTYYSNLTNLSNQNTIVGNALQDTQLGTIDMSGSDVTKVQDKISRCELLNSNSGGSNGALNDNSAGTNPVKTAFASPVLQVSLQNPSLSMVYSPRSSIPVF